MSFSIFGQCADWDKLLGYKNVFVQKAVRDRFGNTFAVAGYMGDVVIGAFNLPTPVDFSHSGILLKMDKNYNILWIKQMGGAFGFDVVIDQHDDIVIGGVFYDPAQSFGCIHFTANNSPYGQNFIMKLTNDGEPLWGIKAEGSQHGAVLRLAITPKNDIIAAGIYEGNTSFQGIHLSGYGLDDAYLLSVTSGGIINWVQGMGSASSDSPFDAHDYIRDMAVDRQGNIVIAGVFGFATFHIGSKTLSSNAVGNCFVAKLDAAGNVLWAKSAETTLSTEGWGITIDQSNNVYFTGVFYETTMFDHLALTSAGDTDVFLVKYDPSGNVLLAKNFGGIDYDQPQALETDVNNNLLIAGHYRSTAFKFGNLTRSTINSDVFIGTLDTQLNTVCLKVTSGSAYKNVWSLSSDSVGNIIALIEGQQGNTKYGTKFSHTDTESTNVMVFMGNNSAYDPGAYEFKLTVNLGPDKTICPTETVTLEFNVCNASYQWSDGSTNNKLQVTEPGVYWLDVTYVGKTVRDSIHIFLEGAPLSINLGDDKILCAGETISVNATQTKPATYVWSDGSVDPEKVLSAPGVYTVRVSDNCSSVSDAITFSQALPLPEVDLGSDQSICQEEELILAIPPVLNAQYEWQDGSTEPFINVSETGIYHLRVFNACESREDDVRVTVIDNSNVLIPNVVTADANKKNDAFIIPESLLGSKLSIYNCWGQDIYTSRSYDNTWTGVGVSAGVYYYVLRGKCQSDTWKGVIHLLSQ